jgi:hypothetical protein
VSAGELLVAGKALLWFAIPIVFAVWQLASVRAELRRDRDRGKEPGAPGTAREPAPEPPEER